MALLLMSLITHGQVCTYVLSAQSLFKKKHGKKLRCYLDINFLNSTELDSALTFRDYAPDNGKDEIKKFSSMNILVFGC